jgi:hypothetical protein
MPRCRTLALFAITFAGCHGSDGKPGNETSDARDPSVAGLWNQALIFSIRNDFARPPIQARNLFHVSAAMYDAWSVYSDTAGTYLLGNEIGGYSCDLGPFRRPDDVHPAREQAISFAVYRMIRHRFAAAPGAVAIRSTIDGLMQTLGFDIADESVAYAAGSPAAMGNYIASCYIGYGLQDGANEANNYVNRYYLPVNPELSPELPGNPNIIDLDRWQPLKLTLFIDQQGNPLTRTPDHQSPEWGQVQPFALTDADRVTYQRDGFDYHVYHDPGPPATYAGPLSADYKWNHALVAIWSSHLDPTDGVLIDISPASIGNLQQYPTDIGAYPQFYDLFEGGTPSTGHAVNPVTGAPYAPQIVPRGDYTRALAEFWADGPNSETPPGHWFSILNEVNDHPQLIKRFGGAGPVLGPLEWDVKAYFALGGAVHDAAITAWGMKGWYDSIRPISAIRAMADRGQSSDPLAASYHPDGLPLVPGYIDLVAPGDPLAGPTDEHVGKIKLYAWRGPDYIANPAVDEAGVGWILAENWWPYQRPTFVTPPFAGWISGHSTYSRAAAEVLTAVTGSEFFPGGMSEFEIAANEFLVFEDGPSVDMTLQWARYRDASDQCSLSRIWGGIHPPMDDIPGRLIGAQVGVAAFELAEAYYNGTPP